MEGKETVYVIGHKNPDTDSVCSAICYARLKEKITGQHYVAKRAGHLNEETQYVMDKLGIQPPEYMKDVRPQVRDIQIRKTPGVSKEISVKTAWTLMKEQNVVTLPVTKENVLEGLITIGDIAKSYFQVYDSTILATAQTRYQNIVDTLEGTVVAGEADGIFKEGKVVIAAANPDMMENYIGTGDIVILGNRYEAQLCAIEMEAGCLIICEGAQVSKTITKVAKEHNCLLITTKFDTYTVARLINQSMPIRFLMKEKEGIVKFQTEDFIEDIQTVMAKLRHRDFPVEDTQGNYVGMISRRNLLGAGKKKLILVDHNERGQAVNGVETAEILEIIDHHRLADIETGNPIYVRNEPVGSTATIVADMYQEKGLMPTAKMAGLIAAAIVSDTVMFKSPTCTQRDIDIANRMSRIANVPLDELGRTVFSAACGEDKSAESILTADYKEFHIAGHNLAVSQVTCMDSDLLMNRKDEFLDAMLQKKTAGELDAVLLMITDVLREGSYLLYIGDEESIRQAFGITGGALAVLFVIYYYNLDMKLMRSVVVPFLNKHYDSVKREHQI